MLSQFRIALAALFVAVAPPHLGAEPQGSLGEPLSAKDVRKAEKNARTTEDHLRLAAWYQLQARQAQIRLTEEEELVA